jgi:hypothetical protein
MPIRFRCCFCNQLLGIAHRKAGTVIDCPTCRGKVWVPQANGAGGSTSLPPIPPGPGDSQEFDVERVPDPGPVRPTGGQSLLPVIAVIAFVAAAFGGVLWLFLSLWK